MYLIQAIRGFMMAMADSVPGVSGGTIAFIMGFYDEFRTVIDLIDQKKINTDSLISDVISLDDIEKQGFERLSTSLDLVKVLVRP